MKFSPPERALLDRLVGGRSAELSRLAGGQRIDMSASAYIRWLVAKEAAAQGIDPEGLGSPEPPPVTEHQQPVTGRQAPSASARAGKLEPGKGRRR